MEAVSEALSTVRRRHAENEAARQEAYLQLVRESCDGAEVDPESILARLDACGHDAEHLHDDVEAVLQHLAKRQETAATRTDFETRRAKNRAWAAEWRERWEKINAEMAQERNAMAKEEGELMYMHPHLLEREQKLVSEARALTERGLASLIV